MDKPPDGFIDHNVYAYRMVDRTMVLKGITLGHGWEHRLLTPGMLSCYKQAEIGKGEDDMAARNDRAVVMAKAKRLMEERPELNLNQVAHEIDVPEGTLYLWFKQEAAAIAAWEEHGTIAAVAKKLGVTAALAQNILMAAGVINNMGQPTEQSADSKSTEPAELGGLAPEQRNTESANTIIPEPIPPVKMPIGCALPKDDGSVEYKPADIQLSPLASVGNQIMLDAWQKVMAVTNDPVALPIIKELIRQGVA